MDQTTAERLLTRLDAIETKLDEILEFRDNVTAFAAASTARRLAMLAKGKTARPR